MLILREMCNQAEETHLFRTLLAMVAMAKMSYVLPQQVLETFSIALG